MNAKTELVPPYTCPQLTLRLIAVFCSPCCANSCVINYSLHTFGQPAKFNRFMHAPADRSPALALPISLSLAFCLFFSLTHMIWSVDSFLLCLVPSVASLPSSKQVAPSHCFVPLIGKKQKKSKVKVCFLLFSHRLSRLYLILFYCFAGSMSNKPILYYAPRSPPCRAVQLTAAALGIELDLRWVLVEAMRYICVYSAA